MEYRVRDFYIRLIIKQYEKGALLYNGKKSIYFVCMD